MNYDRINNTLDELHFPYSGTVSQVLLEDLGIKKRGDYFVTRPAIKALALPLQVERATQSLRFDVYICPPCNITSKRH